MKAVSAEGGHQLVAVAAGEMGEEVYVGDVGELAVLLQFLIDAWNVIGFSRQRFPTAVALVDGEQALYVEFGLGSLLADAVDESLHAVEHLFRREIVTEVVDAAHQEDSTGLSWQYLAEAFRHSLRSIADDAAIDHVVHLQTFIPVAAVLGKTVAEHHDLRGVDGFHTLELRHPLVVMA